MAIHVANLCVMRGKFSIRNVSFEIPSQKCCFIRGKNGSGKTTMLNVLAGILAPDDGKVEVLSMVASIANPSFRERVVLLGDSPRFYPWMRADEVLDFSRHLHCQWQDEIRQKLVSGFDLDLSSTVQRLSFGNLRKLAITECMSRGASIVLMDEPILGLDASSVEFMADIIECGTRQWNKTFVIATHGSELAPKCDCMSIILANGQIESVE